jgi:hypothetical protein
MWNGQRIDCESGLFNGGWVEITVVQDEAGADGDDEVTTWAKPSWYDGAEINQYLWVDTGSLLDWAVDSGQW